MQLTAAIALFLTLSFSGVQGAPVEDASVSSPPLLSKRAKNCQGAFYNDQLEQDGYGDVVTALQTGQRYAYTNAMGVTRFYPGVFNNGENFSSGGCPANGATLYEFPVDTSGNQYQGGFPGPDRAVVQVNQDGTFTQCWFMTHTNQPNNGFTLCT